ncbi:hypothetical protein Cs7R123_27550 [Catellatospora sp. TT07R-123]|uniref:hypothetical protein n=1 Tax=Catellatospora sp. TT07R-123 TaxID=2733863 RepID=UPI001B0C61DB|nr:hypothetical protein [Catellatospora sp. TT07R-123]GHJ45413.1 hypothetical protein Cs7R123_27550 [Catellatospora sp. TT07R-123]
MTSTIRSRRAGISSEEARTRPLYARVLGLQYVRPSNLMCFVFFEGAVALAVLLSLAELTSWWSVLVLPVSVAVMVKVNDVIAGATTRSGGDAVRRPARATTGPVAPLRGAAPPPEVLPAYEEGFADDAGTDLPSRYERLTRHEQAPVEPISPAAEEPWIGSPEQRARQSAMYRYD